MSGRRAAEVSNTPRRAPPETACGGQTQPCIWVWHSQHWYLHESMCLFFGETVLEDVCAASPDLWLCTMVLWCVWHCTRCRTLVFSAQLDEVKHMGFPPQRDVTDVIMLAPQSYLASLPEIRHTSLAHSPPLSPDWAKKCKVVLPVNI